jgi:hypothetical protein
MVRNLNAKGEQMRRRVMAGGGAGFASVTDQLVEAARRQRHRRVLVPWWAGGVRHSGCDESVVVGIVLVKTAEGRGTDWGCGPWSLRGEATLA